LRRKNAHLVGSPQTTVVTTIVNSDLDLARASNSECFSGCTEGLQKSGMQFDFMVASKFFKA